MEATRIGYCEINRIQKRNLRKPLENEKNATKIIITYKDI